MFVNKTLSVLRFGNNWYAQLLGGLVEAGRSNSYFETERPTQSDTLHKHIKYSDKWLFKRCFEECVRKSVKALRLGRVKVALDVTEDPYWGKEGSFNTRAKVHEKSNESWQYINLSIVDPKFIPLMSLPYRQIDDLDNLAIDLLEYLRSLPLQVELVLFDRGFYHWALIDYLNNHRGGKPWPYLILVPKNNSIKEYITKTKTLGVFTHQGKHSKKRSVWKPKTTIVICKGIGKNDKGKPLDWCFATNQKPSLNLVLTYKKRWNIETGFRIHDETRIKSKTSHPLIRYFYHLIGMLLILMWRIHNYVEPYEVFKRYLKNLINDYIEFARGIT